MRIKLMLILGLFFSGLLIVQGHPNSPQNNCSTPTGLTAVITSATANLTWNSVPGSLGYWVEIEEEGTTPPYAVEVFLLTNSYTAAGLLPNGSYKFKVRTKCADDKSDWSSWYNFSTNSNGGGGNGSGNGSCTVPTGLTVSNNTGGSATLSWTTSNGATGYWVEVESENFTPPFHLEVQSATNTYTVTGLTAGVAYKFKVRSTCGSGQSDWSSWTFFAGSGGNGGGGNGGGNGSCTVPTGLTVSNNTGGSATLSWTTSNGATGYWVEVESENFTPPFHLEVQSATNTYTVTGLTAGVAYKFKVRSTCGSGQSDWSSWTFFAAGGGNGGGGNGGNGGGNGSCTVPTGLTVSNNTGGSATLSWTTSNGATGYWVEVESENFTPPFHLEVQAATNTYTVTGLTAGVAYKFKVRSKCGSGQSDWSSWTFFASSGGNGGGSNGGGNGSCTVPTGLTVSNNTGGSATLSWTTSNGATGYWVEVESENFTPPFHLEVQSATNTYTITGLTAGVAYKFKVRSTCGSGQSDWSSWTFFAAGGGNGGGGNGGGNGSCTVPTGLTVSNNTGGSATLSWTTSNGATGYWVEVESENFTPPFHLEVQSATNTYTITGLTAGVAYKFKVRSTCGSGQSDWSSWTFFAAGGGNGGGGNGGGNGSCTVPTGLTVSNNTGGSATLSWTTSNGATGYWVEIESENFTPTFHLEVQLATNTYTVTGLTAGVIYKFKVRSKCGSGQSDWSSWAFFASSGGNGGGSNGSCQTPSLIMLSNPMGNKITVSWGAVTGALAYTIEIENAANNSVYFKDTATVNNTTYTVDSLLPNHYYKLKIKTLCSSGSQSAWSNWIVFNSSNGQIASSNDDQSCSKPNGLMASNITITTATLSWNSVQGALNYMVEVERQGNVNQHFTLSTTDTFVVLNGLLPGSLYKFKVRTYCAGGHSKWSNKKIFTTPFNFISDDSSNKMSTTDIIQTNMTTYPNPAMDWLVVNMDNVKAGEMNYFSIFDLNGKLMVEQSVKTDTSKYAQGFDLSLFNGGIFLLRWTNGQQVIIQKVLVAK